MQGIGTFIPTAVKARYLNQLLEVGFDTLDFGSYVSPAAIPQMRDTAAVLRLLRTADSPTRLLAIVANERGAREAVPQEQISFLGFPLSVSETFQERNTNSSIRVSMERVESILELCLAKKKSLVIYLSMGFGNPYGDPWSPELVLEQAEKIISMGITTISLADTVGVATPESIRQLFSLLVPAFPDVEWGAHLHTGPHNWKEKIEAAWDCGCRRFDGTLKGYGGCPMAADTLTGNMATENILQFARENDISTWLHEPALRKALTTAVEIFS
ncbi:hydroxymethylglutaryl-CoA lyase [Anseongella ginsenosidimutans]|uniref:Hydroxymethylglutaryl-CoA lyase n=1 Tax=Anseongella ginsenosidimutans TaxID=496056 RepID=A0A4R3KRZ4_9SPHI|nr:hydroxymethylglutaryl-CoA lyase [Anseongella ginsenosidimutans]QEC53112.1 hydroxymethylglutaryl-CoA lyase [Anseongella ginsenosidimutans]TCS87730.1 hydroxymethylglutaryl-CoA lyase [Anseongella ginsenosidimutans]